MSLLFGFIVGGGGGGGILVLRFCRVYRFSLIFRLHLLNWLNYIILRCYFTSLMLFMQFYLCLFFYDLSCYILYKYACFFVTILLFPQHKLPTYSYFL